MCFEGRKIAVMGIVNVTPDSFSDGGRYFRARDAIQHAYQLIEEGADVLDIGAESTRPGHVSVDAQEEWKRLKPVLEELCKHTSCMISVDTYKSRVAQRALEMGVQIVNDIWGGLADCEMYDLIARYGCIYIWMHNRKNPPEGSGITELFQETRDGIERCLSKGIRPEQLWIDPGVGFGKTYVQNLAALRHLKEYCRLGYPVLLGTSRKSVIGQTLGTDTLHRLEGSLATVGHGISSGVRMVRVHDVQETVRFSRMMEAILYD